MTASVLMRPQGLHPGLIPHLSPPFATTLFAKFCTVFQLSLCLFTSTKIFCNCTNLLSYLYLQGRSQPNTAGEGGTKKFQVEPNIYDLLKVWNEK